MAEKVIIELEVKEKGAEQGLKQTIGFVESLKNAQSQLNQSIKDGVAYLKNVKAAAVKSYRGVQEAVDKAKKATAKFFSPVTNGFKKIVDVSKKSISSLKKLKPAFDAVGKATKAFGNALKTLGIVSVLLTLFTSLKDVFMSNQKVADLVNRVFESMSIIFNQVTDAIISAYESVSEATGGFDALQKVIGAMLTLTFAPLKMAFYGIKLGIQELMLAWEESVFGDGDTTRIKELNIAINETKYAIAEVASDVVQAGQNIYENIGEAIGEIGAFGEAAIENISKVDAKAAWASSKNIVDLRKNAELAMARNKGLLEQYDQQAEKLRQIRDEERNSLSDRIKANDELGALLDEQEEKMLENARLQVRLAQLEVDKLNNTENNVKLIEAQNELIAIQAQIEGYRSEQKMNDLQLDRERVELQKIYTDAELEAQKVVGEAKASAIVNEMEQLDALEQLKIDQYNEDVARLNSKLNELAAAGRAETKEYADIAAEKIALEADFASEMIGIDTERAAKQKEIEKEKQASIAAMSMQGFQLIGQLAGEGSDLAKAMAVAQVTYETYNAVMSAFSSAAKNPLTSVFPAFPFIQAGLAGAFGAMQIKNLLADNGTGGGSAGGSAASAMVTPSVNLTSAANQNNALGNIAQNTSSPMRAYVVSKDVASAAAYERSRKTIGTL